MPLFKRHKSNEKEKKRIQEKKQGKTTKQQKH